MPGAARRGDTIQGITDNDHVIIDYTPEGSPIYGSSPLSGEISNGSSNVFINGEPAATVGSITIEIDQQDTSSGLISDGSSSVFVNGQPIARIGDNISPHSGTATIISGSNDVIIGG